MRRDSVKLELFLLTLESGVAEEEPPTVVVAAGSLPPNLELDDSSFSCLMEKGVGRYPPSSRGGGALEIGGNRWISLKSSFEPRCKIRF